jgi:hypothetical protein
MYCRKHFAKYEKQGQLRDVGSFTRQSIGWNLTFRGPCIVIYSYNKSQQDAQLLKLILLMNSIYFGQSFCPSSGVLILYSQQLVFVIPVMLTVC